ncbi:hypothetical protein LXL04_031880 [Taraxacum kok-saghyz]
MSEARRERGSWALSKRESLPGVYPLCELPGNIDKIIDLTTRAVANWLEHSPKRDKILEVHCSNPRRSKTLIVAMEKNGKRTRHTPNISGDVPSSIHPEGQFEPKGFPGRKFHHTGVGEGITESVTIRPEPSPRWVIKTRYITPAKDRTRYLPEGDQLNYRLDK